MVNDTNDNNRRIITNGNRVIVFHINDAADDQTIATTSDCSVDNGPAFDSAQYRRRIERKKKCQNWTLWVSFVVGMIVLATIICVPIIFIVFGYGRGEKPSNNGRGVNVRASLEEVQNYIISSGYSLEEDVRNIHLILNIDNKDEDDRDDESNDIFSFDNNINDNLSFKQRRTPQYSAAKFMMYVELPTTSRRNKDENYKVEWKERYAAAVLYYALGGPGWDNKFSFATHNRHVCNWQKPEMTILKNGKIRVFKHGIDCGSIQAAVIQNLPYHIKGIRLVDNNLKSNADNVGIPWRELSLLTELKSLILQDNPGIGGTLPTEKNPEFFWPSSLVDVWLSGTNLSGKIPEGIFNTNHDLILLDMDNNQLTGTIPSSIRQATNLEFLALEHNHLEGTLDTIEAFVTSEESKLEYLHLGDNMFQYELKTDSFSSSTLERLDLSDNPSISGTVPIELLCNTNENVHLEVLDLHGTNITSFPDVSIEDDGDEEDSSFTSKMKFLALFDNPNLRQPKFPTNIITKCMESSLEHLDLTSTSLGYEQSMPTELGLLSNLEYLFLTDTKFLPGPIPTEYTTTMNKLKYLSLKHSSRTGTLPSSIFTNPNSALTLLDLDANMLTGNLSVNNEQSLWSDNVKNENMKYLLLNRNNFTGTIPLSAMLFSLPNLQLLQLSDNLLTGTINTKAISNMRFLRFLFLQGNKNLEISSGNSMEELCYKPMINNKRKRNWRVNCNIRCPCCSCCYDDDNDDNAILLTFDNFNICQDQYDEDFDWLAQYSDPSWLSGYGGPLLYTSSSGKDIRLYGFDDSDIIERETYDVNDVNATILTMANETNNGQR